jgi:hypothetical protein
VSSQEWRYGRVANAVPLTAKVAEPEEIFRRFSGVPGAICFGTFSADNKNRLRPAIEPVFEVSPPSFLRLNARPQHDGHFFKSFWLRRVIPKFRQITAPLIGHPKND